MDSKNDNQKKFDIVIVGGLGHVGLPLGIAFAQSGLKVCLYDKNETSAKIVTSGKLPFIEHGAEEPLRNMLEKKRIQISPNMESVSRATYIILAVGTPIDEHLNPQLKQFLQTIEELKPYLDPSQIIIIRSTVYPRTCKQVLKVLGKDKNWKIAYCPERIAEGFAIQELRLLPQIVSGITPEALQEAAGLFILLSPKVIKTTIEEAELIKLFTNAWRYIQFATTNQFYMIANNFNINYNKLRQAMVDGYGRAADLPAAGFTAGPCLLKDTMQLAAFDAANFLLGHAAMMINEGLPNYLIENLGKRYDLEKVKVGILGMAFKADIDDTRESLSYKLGKILRFHGAQVYYSDEYAKDPTFITKEELIKQSDIIIVGVPHSAYKEIIIPPGKEIVDLW